MVGSIGRTVLALACLLAVMATGPSRAAEEKNTKPQPQTRPEQGRDGGAEAERATQFALPGEDPPQKFVPLHPQTVEERRQIEAVTDYSAARAFEHENLWPDAIALLEKALTLEPDSSAILKRLSSLNFMLGKTDQGLKYGKRVLEADPGDSDTIAELVAYYAKHDPPAAETLLKDVLANPKLDKDSAGYLLAEHELGKLYWDKLHQTEKAADAFSRVVEALDEKAANRLTQADQKRILGGDETSAAAAYLDFGLVFVAAKRYDLAVKAFLRGLVYDEDDSQLPLLPGPDPAQDGQGRRGAGAGRRVPETPAARGRRV